MNLPTVIHFSPENWGAVERFAHFCGKTYTFPPRIQGCVAGTTAHFRRADTLRRIAESMVPSMKADLEELDQKGFSQSSRSSEVTAVIEATITSLYASIDAGRKIVTHIFGSQGFQGFPESTRKTFNTAAAGKLDPRTPEPIRAAFCDAKWYHGLRELRDALAHIGPGNCHLNRETGLVMYFHDAIRDEAKLRYISDIFAELTKYFDSVNRFLGQVFGALLATLKDEEVWQMCGIFSGRLYHRFVRPSEAKDFNSGRCDAHSWFDLPDNPRCPFADICSAYSRRNPNSENKDAQT
ncbi:hypothetical protein [Nibricoccus aquaticus]|uniref:hypothetical protein n=1 Tax=Nibricoccus aquaticus TaxID=2576891 RepID=UPI0010FE35A7|nr:hypothetical protein [Nibricoccus aquaticus]